MTTITEGTAETTGDTTTDGTADTQLAAAGHRVLEMFVAICGAPDDEQVAAEANRALAELARLTA